MSFEPQGGGGTDERKAKVILEADTKEYNENIKKANKETSKLAETVESLSMKFDGMYKKIGKKLIIFGAADLAMMSGMVAVSAQLDKQLSSLGASAAAVGKDFKADEMRDSIRAISREVPVARGQIAALATSMRHLGVDSQRQMAQFAAAFTQLGGATGGSAPELAKAQIGASRSFGNTSTRAITGMNDSLTSVSAAAAVNPEAVLQQTQQLATTARAAGMSQQKTMGLSAGLQRSGAEGQQVGSMFDKLTRELIEYQQTGDPQIKKFAKATGLPVDQVKAMEPEKLLGLVAKKTVGRGKDGVQNLRNLGIEGIGGQQALETVQQQGGLDKYMGISSDAFGSGSTEEGAKAAWNTLQDSMGKVRNNFTDLAQSMGQGVLPLFKTLADGLAAFLEKFTPISAMFLEPLGKIATALGGLSTALGSMMGIAATIATPLFARSLLQRPANFLSRRTGGSGEGGVTGLVKRGAAGTFRGVGGAADKMRGWHKSYSSDASGSFADRGRQPGLFRGMARQFGLGVTGGIPATLSGKMETPKWIKSIKTGMGKLSSSIVRANASMGSMVKSAGRLIRSRSALIAAARKQTSSSVSLAAAAGKASASLLRLATGVATTGTKAAMVSGAGLLGAGVRGAGKGIVSGAKGLTGMVGGPWMAAAMGVGYAGLQMKGSADRAKEYSSGTSDEIGKYQQSIQNYSNSVDEAVPVVNRFSSSLAEATGAIKTIADVTGKNANYKAKGRERDEYVDPNAEQITGVDQAVDYLHGQNAGGMMSPERLESVLTDLGKNEKLSSDDLEDIKTRYKGETSLGTAQQVQSPLTMMGKLDEANSANYGWQQSAIDLFDLNNLPGAGGWFRDVHKGEAGQSEETRAVASQIAVGIGNKADTLANTKTTGNDKDDELIESASGMKDMTTALVNAMGEGDQEGQNKADILVDALRNAGVEGVRNTGDIDLEKVQTYQDMDLKDQIKFVEEELLGNTSERKQLGDKTPQDVLGNLSNRSISKLTEAFVTGIEKAGGSQMLSGAYTQSAQTGGIVQQALAAPSDTSLQSRGASVMSTAALQASGGDALAAQRDVQLYINNSAEGSPERALADSAMSDVQHDYAVKNMNRNRVGQMQSGLDQFTSISQESDENAATKAERLKEARKAAEVDIGNKYMELKQYERSTAREEEDFTLQRDYQNKDFTRSTNRSEKVYQEGLEYSEEDYQLSVERSTADFHRNRERSEQDFERSMLRGKEDFNRQRMRMDEDFHKQTERMAEDSAKAMYDPFKRVFGKYTADASSMLTNMKNQRELMEKQLENLDKARNMGLDQSTIDQLDLANPEQAQQLDRLVQTSTKGEFAELNSEAAKKEKLAGSLNEESVSYKRMEEDRDKQIKRGEEDFYLSRERSVEDFRRSMARSEKDFLRTMRRSEKDREKMLARQDKAHRRSLRWSLRDFNRNIRRADNARYKMLARMKEDFIGIGDETAKSVNEMAKDVAAGYEKHFGAMGAKMSQIIQDTINQINQANNSVDTSHNLYPDGKPTPGPGWDGDKDSAQNKRRGKRAGLARGGIVRKPVHALIGEDGDNEAIVPLNDQGVDFMASVMKKVEQYRKREDRQKQRERDYGGALNRPKNSVFTQQFTDKDKDGVDDRWQTGPGGRKQNTGSQFGRPDKTQGYSSKPSVINKNRNIYNNSTNFNGEVKVESQDPDDMARKLKHKARVRSLRSGSRDTSPFS